MTTDIAAQQEAAEATWIREYLEGPTQTRWQGVPVQVGDAAPESSAPSRSRPPLSRLRWICRSEGVQKLAVVSLSIERPPSTSNSRCTVPLP